jgi:hypothetical protein
MSPLISPSCCCRPLHRRHLGNSRNRGSSSRRCTGTSRGGMGRTPWNRRCLSPTSPARMPGHPRPRRTAHAAPTARVAPTRIVSSAANMQAGSRMPTSRGNLPVEPASIENGDRSSRPGGQLHARTLPHGPFVTSWAMTCSWRTM